MRVRVEVTAEDIAKSDKIRRSVDPCVCCPIWQALRRRLPKPKRIFVAPDWVKIDDCKLPLPKAAREFIAEYDNGNRPDPVTFTLRTPPRGRP